MKQQFYGWKLLAVLWMLLLITIGFPYYGGNIMNAYMATEMQMDRKSLGLAFGVFSLCGGLSAPFAGFCVNKWGARATLSAGALMVTLGTLAMATVVNSMVGIVIAYGLVIGVGISLGGALPAQTVIAFWFRKKLAMAITILSTGAVFGGFVASPLVDKIIVAFDGNWRAGWFLVAALSAVAFCCAMLFVRNEPSDLGQVQDGVVENDSPSDATDSVRPASGVYKTTDNWSVREAVRHPTLWLMILGTLCFLGGYTLILSHSIVHFKDLGHSAGTAAMFMSILPLAALLGKAVIGTLGDRIEPRFIWSASMVVMAIGMAIAVKATTNTELYATAILLGAGNAAAYVCVITLIANYYGKTSYASLMGVVFLLLTAVASTVPILGGMVFDHFGSYALAFYPAAAICFLGGLVMPFVKPPVRALAKLQTSATA